MYMQQKKKKKIRQLECTTYKLIQKCCTPVVKQLLLQLKIWIYDGTKVILPY